MRNLKFCYMRTKPFVKFISYIPQHKAAHSSDIESLAKFIEDQKNILVVTGAGISTESGIPDYRSEKVGLYERSKIRPVKYNDFVNKVEARQRYWARNYNGWPKFSTFRPNANHYSLKTLQNVYKIDIVTQNVDGLHFKAQNKNVVELHGSAFSVKCLSCDFAIPRHQFQGILEDMNGVLNEEDISCINPDGDVDIKEEVMKNFKFPDCFNCGGIIKPDVVFFGENVPKERVQLVKNKVDECNAVLVLGSSLTVFSSYRIILQASESKKGIAIINIGPTRADDLANLRLHVRCGEVLPPVCSMLDNNHPSKHTSVPKRTGRKLTEEGCIGVYKKILARKEEEGKCIAIHSGLIEKKNFQFYTFNLHPSRVDVQDTVIVIHQYAPYPFL